MCMEEEKCKTKSQKMWEPAGSDPQPWDSSVSEGKTPNMYGL